jgi:hypothetical protein
MPPKRVQRQTLFGLHSEQIAMIKPLVRLTWAPNRNLPDRGRQVSLGGRFDEIDALFLCVHPSLPFDR